VKIYIGADHNGFAYKKKIVDFLVRSGHEIVDSGDVSLNLEDDFPQFASKVVNDLKSDKDPEAKGLLICGSGQGMCMAANRYKGIRASLCWNVEEARSARNDDDSNILCLSARYSDLMDVEAIITTWLSTPFAGASRFTRRIKELDSLG
jgi:ribose 5-phosphate isomerase B